MSAAPARSACTHHTHRLTMICCRRAGSSRRTGPVPMRRQSVKSTVLLEPGG